MRTALLRGRDHLELGGIASITEGSASIALSIGGSPKTYEHTDPNEDAALFAIGESGILLAVADGHHGFEAAEISLEHLASYPAPQWTEPGGVGKDSWERHALASLCDIDSQILREVRNTEKRGSATTLALALVLPEAGTLFYAAVGDSHIFHVRVDGVEDIAQHQPEGGKSFYLGRGVDSPESLLPRCIVGTAPLRGTRALVLATDGLSEQNIGVPDPEAAVAEVVAASRSATPELRPREVARRLLDVALDAHHKNASGDNVCAAVAWLED